jgi:hypothetical protein
MMVMMYVVRHCGPISSVMVALFSRYCFEIKNLKINSNINVFELRLLFSEDDEWYFYQRQYKFDGFITEVFVTIVELR